MKKVTKDAPILFYHSFDELFEKPKILGVKSRKLKIWTTVAITATALLASAPFLTVIVISIVSQSIINTSQKKIDAIKASEPFTEHNILKETFSLAHTPDYSTAKAYAYKVSPDKIVFGNGFKLDIKNSKGLNEDFTHHDLEIKAKTGYSTVEPLAQYNFANLTYKDMTSPIEVFISGNLIESYEVAIDKSKGSWAKVYQLGEKWNIKTGYVINYQSPKYDSSQSYIYMTRYWIFPDGVGVTVEKSGVFDGTLTPNSTKTTPQEDLDVINQYSQGMLGQLQNNFVMTTEK